MFKVASAVCAVLIVGGCAVTPEPLKVAEFEAAKSDRIGALAHDQEPVTKAITLYEAMARAIKYNLDYKVELFEEALRVGEAKLVDAEMLPDLVASAGLSGRDSFNATRSSQLLGADMLGDSSDSVSTSTERNIVDANLKLSWDVLDFGLSYVRAKQSADKVLIAGERKRKVVNRVIANVRSAYWRAVSAERLVSRMKSFEADIEKALKTSEEAFRVRRTAPLMALTYQRELLEIQQQLQAMESEMRMAKVQLAALMNLTPGTKFTLKVPEMIKPLPEISVDTDALIDIALLMRPELRELSYDQRINKMQAEAALLEVLPNFSVFGGFNRNTNEYLYNNDWVNWGAQASWNVFNAFKYPQKKHAVELNSELLRQQALALTMAVMTQVHVGVTKYDLALKKMNTMRRFHRVNNSIMEQISAGYDLNKVSYQTYVRENMNDIVADAKFDIAYAELQNAYADVFVSLGKDIAGSGDASGMTLQELTKHLENQWDSLTGGLKGK